MKYEGTNSLSNEQENKENENDNKSDKISLLQKKLNLIKPKERTPFGIVGFENLVKKTEADIAANQPKVHPLKEQRVESALNVETVEKEESGTKSRVRLATSRATYRPRTELSRSSSLPTVSRFEPEFKKAPIHQIPESLTINQNELDCVTSNEKELPPLESTVLDIIRSGDFTTLLKDPRTEKYKRMSAEEINMAIKTRRYRGDNFKKGQRVRLTKKESRLIITTEPKTLILDLDETLVHTEDFTEGRNYSFVVDIKGPEPHMPIEVNSS